MYLTPTLHDKHLLEKWFLSCGLLVVHKVMATDPELTGLKFTKAVLYEHLIPAIFPWPIPNSLLDSPDMSLTIYEAVLLTQGNCAKPSF